MYVSPRPLLPEILPARPRSKRLTRFVLAFAAIAIFTVMGAQLVRDYGVPAPLPCWESLPAACAAP